MAPIVSVVMSTYNRAEMLGASIESILNQTFQDFEFIIINDCSTDNTVEILQKYNDRRIKTYTNRINCGCTFNYHSAQNIAKGKYIAHIDDDDISKQERLEKQVNYMETHEDIALSGTFIETFGENQRPSWVFYTNSLKLDFMMNLYNPICHSAIMYRTSFINRYAINYDISKKCSQDYDLYKQILLKGGKIANLDDILVEYRMHQHRITDIKETQLVQVENAEKVKKELLLRYLDANQIEEFSQLVTGFPFNEYNKDNVIKAIDILRIGYKNKNIEIDETADEIVSDIENDLFRF